MTTKILGIKEFRKKITSIWKESKSNNIRYIVMHHSKPIFEVNPIHEDELILENFASNIAKAREEVKKGEVYSIEETYKALGIQ